MMYFRKFWLALVCCFVLPYSLCAQCLNDGYNVCKYAKNPAAFEESYVFISYSRSDQSAVEIIRDSLTANCIYYWDYIDAGCQCPPSDPDCFGKDDERATQNNLEAVMTHAKAILIVYPDGGSYMIRPPCKFEYDFAKSLDLPIFYLTKYEHSSEDSHTMQSKSLFTLLRSYAGRRHNCW